MIGGFFVSLLGWTIVSSIQVWRPGAGEPRVNGDPVVWGRRSFQSGQGRKTISTKLVWG
jgi:hypothetical protein